MALLTVRQAALQVGISRQTMFRHIKQGKVSASLAHDGELRIDTSELLRVYGALQSPLQSPSVTSSAARQSQATADTPETVALQIDVERLKAQLESKSAQLAMTLERIEELKAQVSEARADRDRLLALVEQQGRLLAAPTSKKRKSKR